MVKRISTASGNPAVRARDNFLNFPANLSSEIEEVGEVVSRITGTAIPAVSPFAKLDFLEVVDRSHKSTAR